MMISFLQTSSFSLHKMLNDWSHVDYCDVFISCLDSHSDGTHSLQRKPLLSEACHAKFLGFFIGKYLNPSTS